MDNKYKSLFFHSYDNFSKQHISSSADEYGLAKRDVLESHLWIYELYAHIQQYAGEKCVLKGGACAQLYLPLEYQRCTADIDAATSLAPKELEEVLHSIRYEFNIKKFYTSYSEYIPDIVKRNGKTLPLMTYLFNLPFIFNGGKRKKTPAPSIKLDFLFLDTEKLSKNYITKGETIGLKLNYSPLCISPYSLICDKLLIFAVNSIGLEIYKSDGFYKNIYDLFYLINTYNNIDDFKLTCDQFKESAYLEFNIKNMTPINLDLLFEDISYNLYRLSIRDLDKNIEPPSKRLVKFQENALQKYIRDDLSPDTWSIMSMYLYIWTLAAKDYFRIGDSSKLNIINKIINQYEYYSGLSNNAQIKYLNTLKSDIMEIDNHFYLEYIKEPLRLIYLSNIVSI